MASPGDDEVLLDAARAVRPYLPALAGERAGEVDAGISALLARAADGQDVVGEVAGIFGGSDDLRTWVAAYLERGVPPEVAGLAERSYQGLPGMPEVPAPEAFRCPRGDYVFYRRAVGVSVPRCPTHGLALVR